MSNILVNENGASKQKNGHTFNEKEVKYVNFEVVSTLEIEKDGLTENDFE